ncbi:MAG: glycosyltransferase family 4 protein [Solirubrobacteraceae bacterium]
MSAVTRVAFVTYDDEPPLGGQGVVLRGMRRGLVARGHTVRTVSGRGEHAVRYPRVTGRAPLDFSLHINRHTDLVRRLDADVVHVNGGPGGVLLLRDVRAPVVYTAHHTYRQAHGRMSLHRMLSLLESRAYRRAQSVLAVSPSTARAVALLGVPARHIEVLAPGVDGPMADAPPREEGRLFFAGRWETEKGVLDAVEVMGDVLRVRPGATARVAGSGPLESEVRRAATARGVEVLGRVDDRELRAEYARATIVVMPSLYEGLGLVALEAQAAGAVVVGYDVDGLRDAVLSETLVGAGDVRGAVDRCLELLDDDDARAALASAAQREVLATHSWDAVAERLEEVYASLCR